MKHLLLAGVAAAGLCMAGAAVAGPLSLIAGGSGTYTLSSFPPAGQLDNTLPLFGLPQAGPGYGYYGASVMGPGGRYRIDYFGAEAAFKNQFAAPGASVLFNTTGVSGNVGLDGTNIALSLAQPLGTAYVTLGAGVLDFRFIIDGGNGGVGVVTNAGNPDDKNPNVPKAPSFIASFDPTLTSAGGTTGNGVYLFLDDGAQIDDNHDDMLVRITYVPEPASLALLGAGLLGLGLARRRRQAV